MLIGTYLKTIFQFVTTSVLVGCSTATLYSYKPILTENHEHARQVFWGEKNVIELTNKRFKLFVYSYSSYMAMSLFVPTGEELYIQEPYIEITNTSNQEVLGTYQTVWDLDEDAHTQFIQTQNLSKSDLDKYIDLISTTDTYSYTDANRLVGLEELPPVTIYRSTKYLPSIRNSTLSARLPVFRTKTNEIIKFEDVLFKTMVYTKIDDWYWDDFFKTLWELGWAF